MKNKTSHTVDEVINDKQRQAMEGFIKMMGAFWGDKACQNEYENFLKQDSSALDKCSKDKNEP